MAAKPDTPRAEEVLRHWKRLGPLVLIPHQGLINRTWFVGGEPDGDPASERTPRAVLQWVNGIFSPKIHHDIDSLTRRLLEHRVVTPRLLTTPDGDLWIEEPEPILGCWRLATFVDGVTHDEVRDLAMAAEAGKTVGRFHRAVDGWRPELVAPQRHIHDTPKRMAELAAALASADDHPLAAEARRVGAEILARWRSWDGGAELPERVCHGDLKISNVLFDRETGEGLCLIDLDTVGQMTLASEMGDAWRSWCNPAGEDDPENATFDVDIFTASAAAWREHGPAVSRAELEALVPGIERIALELAARFCADAVRNSYFSEDRERFPAPGRHNLVRAESQLRVAAAVRECRPRCERVLLS